MRYFEADEKIITRNSSSEWLGYFAFVDLTGLSSPELLFGEDEASFLHQLMTVCNYSSSWKGREFVRPNVWPFTPLNPIKCLNYAALGIL